MIKIVIFIAVILLSSLIADLHERGARIAKTLCDGNKLKELEHPVSKDRIKSLKICSKMSEKNLSSLIAFLNKDSSTTQTKQIEVPKKAACPVCGMWVAKYPKWVAQITLKDEKLYFDGVKDMMKFYFDPKRFHHKEIDPIDIKVSDYYSIKSIDAKKAFYVLGSNIYGPMGEELIPFQKRDDAKAFKMDHDGKKIVTFDKIRENMLYN